MIKLDLPRSFSGSTMNAIVCSLTVTVFLGLSGSWSVAAEATAPAKATAPGEATAPGKPLEAVAWADRNSPVNQAASARAFLDLLVLDARTWRLQPAMVRVVELAQKNQDVEALDAYTRFFLNRNARDTEFARSSKGPPDREKVLAAADGLMEGKMMVGGKPLELGPPGQVNWGIADGNEGRFGPAMTLHDLSAFQSLPGAYLLTRDHKYLDRWADYLDDWAMNDATFDLVHPCIVPDKVNSNSAGAVTSFAGTLASLTRADWDQPPIPPRVFANVVRKLFAGVLPLHVSYIRSNTHNWTFGWGLMRIAQLFPEFRASEFYLLECRRRNIEDPMVTQNLPDGSENQQDPWYNGLFAGMAHVLERLGETSPVPGWNALRTDVDWRNRLRGELDRRVTFQIHLRTPQGEWPVPFRGGDKRAAAVGAIFEDDPYSISPEAFEDPVNIAILKGRNPLANVTPPYTSEWFPYGGYNIVREGWRNDDGYGAMFCSPVPGAYGGYRGRSNNNSFGIAFNGQDLLIDDTTGHYMYPSAPVTVDGRSQFFHAGVYKVQPPAAHKVFQINAWDQPADWRWHASDRFNLMEGVYAGSYGNLKDAESEPGPYGQDDSAQGTMRVAQTIRGVTHQRLALYLRGPKLWIVTDRMLSDRAHDYEQAWYLPIQPGPPAFAPEQISVDAEKRMISTHAEKAPAEPNKEAQRPRADVTLHQFSTAALKYQSKVVLPERNYNRYTMYGRQRIGVAFSGQNAQIVTAILPRALDSGAAGELRDVKQITAGASAVGFSALTPDGTVVQYLSLTTNDEELVLGAVRLRGGALLLAGDSGIALDCQAFAVNGRQVANAPSDFEFTLGDDGAATIHPIYRPIAPVKISPPINRFVDTTEIRLSCATAGVEIRYTTDGSEPTPFSTKYEKPFVLDHSAIVQARAYRPGMTHNPYQTSGTDATVISSADLDRVRLTPAVQRPRSEAGLACGYFQDDWRRLLLDIDQLKPSSNRVVTGLWDFSVIPALNPPVDPAQVNPRKKTYGLVYSGFLDIPADGVYTLTAPREYVWPDVDAGYELRVELGQHYNALNRVEGLNQWYPATQRHGFGSWSVGLSKGLHPFRLVYIDWRTNAAAKLNVRGLKDYIWSGTAPELTISGPGLEAQPIPTNWLRH